MLIWNYLCLPIKVCLTVWILLPYFIPKNMYAFIFAKIILNKISFYQYVEIFFPLYTTQNLYLNNLLHSYVFSFYVLLFDLMIKCNIFCVLFQHEACNHGFVEITKLLLDNGALVNVPSQNDNIMPIHDALINDQLHIAILLASRGADMHAKYAHTYPFRSKLYLSWYTYNLIIYLWNVVYYKAIFALQGKRFWNDSSMSYKVLLKLQ